MKRKIDYNKEFRETFLQTVNNSWQNLVPIIITLISGGAVFYSGVTSVLYNSGYYGVFSIDGAFVEKNMGLINNSLLSMNAGFIVDMICFILPLKIIYNVIKKIRSVLDECHLETITQRYVFFKESVIYTIKNIFPMYLIMILLLFAENAMTEESVKNSLIKSMEIIRLI